MKEKYILIHDGIDPKPEIIELDADHLLDGMRRAIGCDCIEVVHVQTGLLLPHGVVMVADESGWFRGAPRVNKFATVWYHDVIVGNVMLAAEGYRNGEPDLVGLNDMQLKYLRDAFDI